MATVILVRHAVTPLMGRVLAGRLPGGALTVEGRRQAERLAERLSLWPVAALHTSPQERAKATAAPIGRRLRLPAGIEAGLDEIDFGEWTGRHVDALAPDGDWHRFNTYRSGTRIPGGETLLEVQTRMIGTLERLTARHPEGTVVVVGHGDPIRAALVHFLGMPLDLMRRIEIAPASLSVVDIAAWGPTVLRVNDTGAD